MSTNKRAIAWLSTLCVAMLAIPLNGCSDASFGSAPVLGEAVGWVPKATGTVEIVWPGGKGKVIPPGEEKLAFAEVTVFEATEERPARGAFVYRVLNADGSPHREIVAEVTGAVVDPDQGKAWMIGVVTSDTKICSGGGHDGDGCNGDDGSGTHDDGGCSGSDGGMGGGDMGGGCGGDDGTTHDDGGCSGSDGGMGGGDMGGGCGGDDGTTHDEGGCSGSDGGMGGGDMGGGCGGDDGTTHDDDGCSGSDGGMGGGDMGGGCSGDDGTTHDDGGCSGSDGHGGAGGVPGNAPRVGQIVVLKLHDRGTPGFSDDGIDTNDDGITWKWFLPDNPMLPTIDAYATWSHLCKKTIIGGNLTVHVRQN
ncbi:MAG: hypothetical protein OEW06_05440 [Gemmatimonadota bacterium]|nr:hypothetical protein [Gemmatimonadota bacterium]